MAIKRFLPSLAVSNDAAPLGWSQNWSHLLATAANHSRITTSNALQSLPWAQGSPVGQSAAKLPLGPAVPATSTHRRRERWLPLGAALRAPQQYIRQAEQKTNVVLFGRLSTADRAFWCLGPATYVTHEPERERPIGITWRLDHRLSGGPLRRVRSGGRVREVVGPEPRRGTVGEDTANVLRSAPVAVQTCTVIFTGPSGIRHSVGVNRGVRLRRGCFGSVGSQGEWLGGRRGARTELEVQVRDPFAH